MIFNTEVSARRLGRRRVKMPLLLFALCGAWQLCWAIEGDKQTIGELLDRNAQNPDRLILTTTPKQQISNAAKARERARLAAIEHYERVIGASAAPAIRAEAMRRAADLRVEFIDGELSHSGASINGDASKNQELKTAITLYSQLLSEYPNYSAADYVLYQMARAYDLSELQDSSIDTLRRLSREFPESKRVYESSFRAAEMLYLYKRYSEAIVEYQRITAKDSSAQYWWLAQYKQAWTYYQLDDYSASVSAFAKILDALKIQSEIRDLAGLLAFAPNDKAELVRDAVRGMSTAFSKLARADGINDYFAAKPNQFYSPVIYRELAEIYSREKRYTDAASVYESFARLNPRHILAQQFSERGIASYRGGGFNELAVTAQEQYIGTYGPGSALWQAEGVSGDHRRLIRRYMQDVVTYRHAQAQQLAKTNDEPFKQHFSDVAERYLAIITSFPEDENLEDVVGHYADALYESERFDEAALQYGKLAYEYANPERAGDSALAQVKSYRQWYRSLQENQASESDLGDTRIKVFNAIAEFANRFPDHKQRSSVLLAAAEDHYQLAAFSEVVEICLPLISANNWSDEKLHSKALGLLADSYFALKDYTQSENYYTALLPLMDGGDNELKRTAKSRLTISVFRQAELAKQNGQPRLAAELFQRSAHLSVDKGLAAEATFNAAGQLFEAKDWLQSASLLERFSKEFSGHNMLVDAEKMLAAAYQKAADPIRAARTYERISRITIASADLRRTAQLSAGNLYISAGQRDDGARVLSAYLRSYPLPLEDAQSARFALSELYAINSTSQTKWLRDIVAADAASREKNSKSQLMAADASYKLAMADVDLANSISLSLPIEKSLPRRQAAMEKAIGSLVKSSSFGFSDITTLANYELGELYRKFAMALLESEIPKKMDDDVREQYLILLEEQAYPFEEKAIAEYKSNMDLIDEGVWTPGVRKSVIALAELAPAKYGKQPKLEKVYDSLY